MRIGNDGRIIRGSIFLIIVALFVASFFLNPLKYNLNTCGFKEMTGYSCPSCGLTRSFFSISHLHFGDAFSYHLIGPLLYLFLLSAAVKYGYEAVTGNVVRLSISARQDKIYVITFLGIWLIYWIVRIIGEMN